MPEIFDPSQVAGEAFDPSQVAPSSDDPKNWTMPVDWSNRAPDNVRALVASAQTPEQKLAAIQAVYPDAKPFGADNFIYTNPETKKLTMMKTPGIDTGDIAAMVPELAKMVGMTGGALLGAAGGPATSVAAAGAGSMVGGRTYDMMLRALMGLPQQPLATQASSAANDVLSGSAAQAIGIPVNKMVAAMGGPDAGANITAAAYKSLGITPPTLGSVWNNPLLRMMEGALDKMPFSAGIMNRSRTNAIGDLSSAVQDTAGQIGTPMSAENLGKGAASEAGIFKSAFGDEARAKESDMYSKFGTPSVPAQTGATVEGQPGWWSNLYPQTPPPASLANTQEFQAQRALGLSPAARNAFLSKTNGLIGPIAEDDANGVLNIPSLRGRITELEQAAKEPNAITNTGVDQGNLYGLIGALKGDRSAAVNDAGYWPVLNDYNRWYSNTSNKTAGLSRFFGQTPSSVTEGGEVLMPDAQKTGQALMSPNVSGDTLKLLGDVLPETRDNVVASRVAAMGRATPSNQDWQGNAFSPSTLMTNADRSRPVQDAMFTDPDLARRWDSILQVGQSLKEAEKYTNHSNTAATQQWMNLLGVGGVGAFANAAADKDHAWGKTAAYGAAGMATPLFLALALRNPKFLAQPGVMNYLSNPYAGMVPVAAQGAINALAPKLQ